MNTKTFQHLLTASLASLLVVSVSDVMAKEHVPLQKDKEKCYGISLAGQNDCSAGPGTLMCQRFSGHKVKQHFAASRSQRAIYIHWRNVIAPGYRTLRYIQTQPV